MRLFFSTEHERAPLKKGDAQKLFELSDLAADRRLLDAIRDVADGFADAAVAGHVIEQLQMMNIHASVELDWRGLFNSRELGASGKELAPIVHFIPHFISHFISPDTRPPSPEF
jgi:hypothetical protein